MSKKTIRSVIIITIIIVLIGGVWILKNKDSIFAKSSGNSQVSGDFKDTSNKSSEGNSDFTLDISGDFVELDKLKGYNLPIILDFSGTTCPPCLALRPTLEELNIELQGKAIVKIADVWANEKLAEGFPLRVVPTIFFFDAHGNPYIPPEENPDELLIYNDKDSGEHLFTVKEGIIKKERLLAILEEMGLE